MIRATRTALASSERKPRASGDDPESTMSIIDCMQ